MNTTSPAPASQRIGRETASKINPLIGLSDEETLGRCSAIVRDLGYVMSGANQMSMPLDMSNWYQMFETVSAAMSWELARMQIERRDQPTSAEGVSHE